MICEFVLTGWVPVAACTEAAAAAVQQQQQQQQQAHVKMTTGRSARDSAIR